MKLFKRKKRPKEKEPEEIERPSEEEPLQEEVREAPNSVDEPLDADVKPEEEKRGFFKRLRTRLSNTRKAFTNRIDELLLGKREIDEDLLEELEEILITSDIGVQTSMALIDHVREGIERKDLNNPQELKQALQDRILSFLQSQSTESSEAAQKQIPTSKPYVIVVVGVNGVGKTTTIGKLAAHYIKDDKQVLLVAADTFRAAAVEQLQIWGDRGGCDVIKHKGKSDPSAVVFDGIQAAKSRDTDVVIIDTAGRLHTKVNLMEELKKIHRTISRLLPDAPHETLLVLDATTGQNAISQAQLFHEAINLTGIALTKLDGTAKGGIVVGICNNLGVPLKYIGIGEKIDDLQEFNAEAFMKALF